MAGARELLTEKMLAIAATKPIAVNDASSPRELLRRHRDMNLPLTAAMWRKDMLAALLISQKIIDARPLRNREFSVIWETISEQDEEITPKQITPKSQSDQIHSQEKALRKQQIALGSQHIQNYSQHDQSGHLEQTQYRECVHLI